MLCMGLHSSFAEDVFAKLVRIVDGDTLVVEIDGKEKTVDLFCVKTEEYAHPDKKKNTELGRKAAEALREWLDPGERLRLHYNNDRKQSNPKKLLAHVYSDSLILQCIKFKRIKPGLSLFQRPSLPRTNRTYSKGLTSSSPMIFFRNISVNISLIENGYSPYYTRHNIDYKKDHLFIEAERHAKQNKLGIWKTEESRKKYKTPEKEWLTSDKQPESESSVKVRKWIGSSPGPGLEGFPVKNIRFIRIKHNGKGWDHNMNNNAGNNALLQIKNRTGASANEREEVKTLVDISRMKKEKIWPVLYITGTGKIPLSSKEIKILRNHLLNNHGMIFADNAGGSFHSEFTGLMNKIVPDVFCGLIAADDPIYLCYYIVPGGAPMIHSFSKTKRAAMGWKYRNRWIVYYHLGDISDAWRSGHSGFKPAVVERAYQTAVNVFYYAVKNYIEQIKAQESQENKKQYIKD